VAGCIYTVCSAAAPGVVAAWRLVLHAAVATSVATAMAVAGI